MKRLFFIALVASCAAPAASSEDASLAPDASSDAPDPAHDAAPDAAPDAPSSTVTEVAPGGISTCALRTGTPYCWGNNFNQLLSVDSFNSPIESPRAVTGLPSGGWIAITRGEAHACVLDATGRVACWGSNADGVLGSSELTSTGPVVVGGLGPASAIAAGFRVTCALLAEAAVPCWGDNLNHQLATAPVDESAVPVPIALAAPATAIAAGGDVCALLATDAVTCWGPSGATPHVIDGLHANLRAIAVGIAHACALDDDGAVQCWGNNYYGQLGDGTNTPRSSPSLVALADAAVRISASGNSTCALLASGAVQCWGNNSARQLGEATTETWSGTPVTVTGLGASIENVSVGGFHACARRADGSLVCWGWNTDGQLGLGTQGPTGKGDVLGFP